MSSPSYTFTKGADGSNYTPNTEQELGNMICKIAMQIIRNAEGYNPLEKFKKRPPENGDTIEQAIVEMASAEAYDKDGAAALTRKDPSIAVRYFKEWTRRKFQTTVDENKMSKVLLNGKGVGEIASKVVNSCGQGNIDEDFAQMKAVLKWGRQDQTGKVLKLFDTIPATLDGKIDYKNFLIAVKDTVKGMKFSNAKFNTAQLKRKTREEDIYIFMPYELLDRVDVDELAGVFNLDKAELKNRIIEIDTEEEEISNLDSYVVYIVDQNCLMFYNRLYKMLTQLNADGDFWNYFLHSEDMYGISPLFDCGYIIVNTEKASE